MVNAAVIGLGRWGKSIVAASKATRFRIIRGVSKEPDLVADFAAQNGFELGTEFEEAIDRARAGDQRARAGLERVGRYLGVGIANMIIALTPQRVVLGGGVAASADLLLDTIRDEVHRHVFTTSLDGVDAESLPIHRHDGRSR